MRSSHSDNDYPDQKPDWSVIAALTPYLMEFRGRVVLALLFLVGAKVATVAVPVALKYIVDYLDQGGSTEMLTARTGCRLRVAALLLHFFWRAAGRRVRAGSGAGHAAGVPQGVRAPASP